MKATLPAYRVVITKLLGAPYSSHSLYLGAQCIYSCLSPMSEDEIEQRSLAHLSPPVVPPLAKFTRGAGRPKRMETRKGDQWRTPQEDE